MGIPVVPPLLCLFCTKKMSEFSHHKFLWNRGIKNCLYFMKRDVPKLFPSPLGAFVSLHSDSLKSPHIAADHLVESYAVRLIAGLDPWVSPIARLSICKAWAA